MGGRGFIEGICTASCPTGARVCHCVKCNHWLGAFHLEAHLDVCDGKIALVQVPPAMCVLAIASLDDESPPTDRLRSSALRDAAAAAEFATRILMKLGRLAD